MSAPALADARSAEQWADELALELETCRDLMENAADRVALPYDAARLRRETDAIRALLAAYHAEQQPDADGWNAWGGGQCPVEGYAVVDIMCADGDIARGFRADVWSAGFDWWLHEAQSPSCNIIAYRVTKP